MLIAYFAQDLADPAVAKRVRMLRAGGADVKLLGFRRSAEPIKTVENVPAIDLGRTYDGKLANRFALVLQRSLAARRLFREVIANADALLARNLEMVTIAHAARRSSGLRMPLVYECLDIHGSLLGRGIPSRLLRNWDKRLLQKVNALVVSSPGFVTNYFDALEIDLPPVFVTENKRVLMGKQVATRPQAGFDRVPPWKIGWFGIIRCVESFRILQGLAQRHPLLVDVEIRGRPTPELQNLIDQHLPTMANMRFGGEYAQTDLAAIYRNCHLTWAIDYFQKGQNSDWLLPNRIYEGGFHNRPAIALAATETARWLNRRGAGVVVADPAELDQFVTELTISRYADLQRSTAAIPTDDLVDTVEDCRRFVARITGT